MKLMTNSLVRVLAALLLVLTTHQLSVAQSSNYNYAPTYSDAEYRSRLASIPTSIPLTYNSHVRAFIEVYTVRKRHVAERVLGYKDMYFPIFEQKLREQGMPDELKYLAVCESALNTNAVSSARATGLWQMMRETAVRCHVAVNSTVDNRRDPYKATDGGLHYLKKMHKTFGNWLLAVAAYNCGPGNVRKAIRRSGGKRNFWQIRRYLPRETRSYVPSFIACIYWLNHAEQHNLRGEEPYHANTFRNSETLYVKKPYSFKRLASYTGIPINTLRVLNPALIKEKTPNYGYYLRLPAGHATALNEKLGGNYRYANQRQNNPFRNRNTYNSRPTYVNNTYQSQQMTTYYQAQPSQATYGISNAYSAAPQTPANYTTTTTGNTKIYEPKNQVKIADQPSINSLLSKAAASVVRSEAKPVYKPAPLPKPQNYNLYPTGSSRSAAIPSYGVSEPYTLKSLTQKAKPTFASNSVRGNSSRTTISNNAIYTGSIGPSSAPTYSSSSLYETSPNTRSYNSYDRVLNGGSYQQEARRSTGFDTYNSGSYNEPERKKVLYVDVEKSAYTQNKALLRYRVKKGDNLSMIAQLYNCKMSDIRQWNNFSGNTVQKGSDLKIWVDESQVNRYAEVNRLSLNQRQVRTGNTTTVASAKAQSRINKNAVQNYKVRRGDTLWSISKKYPQNTISDLRRLNKLRKNQKIRPGLLLKVKRG